MAHDVSDEIAKDAHLPASSVIILWCAGVASAVWIVAAVVMARSNAATMKLNEWGDFSAGTFAPIAFVWLVVAVLLQSTELREQRKELTLTRQEFRHNREVMQAQAEEAKNQATYILKQTTILENTERNSEAERIFNDAVEHVATRLRQYVGSAWNIVDVADWDNGEPLGSLLDLRRSMYNGEDDILVIATTVQVLRTAVRGLKTDEHLQLHAEFPYDFQRVFGAVVNASDKIDKLPPRFNEKASTLELDELKKHMSFIADNAGITPFSPITHHRIPSQG